MTPQEEAMIDLKLQIISDNFEALKDQIALQTKNYMLQIEVLTKEIQMQKEMFTLITEHDRKINLKTLENTEKTNGRVLDLERTRNDHIIKCPRVTEIEDIYKEMENFKKSIEDLTFVQRHPGLFLALITVANLLSIYAVLK